MGMCEYYFKSERGGECMGTKECESTNCQGDRKRCNFYPQFREQACKEVAQYLTQREIIEIVNDAARERGKKVPFEFYERLIKC